MEELLILHETEFQLLAAAFDFTKIYGIPPKERPDEAAVMYSIHEMAEKGILKEEGSKLRLTEPYRTAIQTMKQARRILSVNEVQEPLSNVCFYIGDIVVCLEESRQDENSVKIGTFELQELCDQLSDRELLPDSLWPEDIQKLHARKEPAWSERQKYARFQVFVPGSNGESEEDFYLFKIGGNYWVSEHDDEDSQCDYYDKVLFFERLWECLNNPKREGGW